MANYILKELPGEMTDGKKVVFPKVQALPLIEYKRFLQHMHMFIT